MDLPNCITDDITVCNNDDLGAEICLSIMILRHFTNVVKLSLTFINVQIKFACKIIG